MRDKDTERVEGKAEIEQLSRKIITSLVDPALFGGPSSPFLVVRVPQNIKFHGLICIQVYRGMPKHLPCRVEFCTVFCYTVNHVKSSDGPEINLGVLWVTLLVYDPF